MSEAKIYSNYQNLICDLDRNTHILHITLNRANQLNALNIHTFTELQDIFSNINNDPRVAALLLSGSGNAFCAGADIKQLVDLTSVSGSAFAKAGQAVCNTLEQLAIPTLAAIHGYAYGGGCELAMATTFRFAATTAKFAQPEVKLGIIPGFGGTQRLPRYIGLARAMDICLTGRTFTAQEAFQWGLVIKVCPEEELLTQAKAYLTSLLHNAPLAINYAKQALYKSELPLTIGLEYEAANFALCCATPEKQEGVEAFLTKRSTKFQRS